MLDTKAQLKPGEQVGHQPEPYWLRRPAKAPCQSTAYAAPLLVGRFVQAFRADVVLATASVTGKLQCYWYTGGARSIPQNNFAPREKLAGQGRPAANSNSTATHLALEPSSHASCAWGRLAHVLGNLRRESGLRGTSKINTRLSPLQQQMRRTSPSKPRPV